MQAWLASAWSSSSAARGHRNGIPRATTIVCIISAWAGGRCDDRDTPRVLGKYGSKELGPGRGFATQDAADAWADREVAAQAGSCIMILKRRNAWRVVEIVDGFLLQGRGARTQGIIYNRRIF